MDIKELLKNIDNNVLSEESKSQICDVFEKVVNEKVASKIDEAKAIAVKEALDEQDASHSKQLSTLLEAVDKDHSAKLKKLVTRIDEDNSAKLQEVVNKYETQLAVEAKQFSESLENHISDFLDLTIDAVLPKNMLKEAVSNTKAAQKLAKIQELVSVDESFINDYIKEALLDGKKQIETLKDELNQVLKENVKIGTEKNKLASELLIEKKTKSLPKDKKLFLEKTFAGKSPSYIEENFDYTVKLFERKEQEIMEREGKTILTESVAKKVDTPKEKQSNTDNEYSYISEYVSGLK